MSAADSAIPYNPHVPSSFQIQTTASPARRSQLLTIVLAAASLVGSCAAQKNTPIKKQSPPPIPFFDVKFTPDPDLSITLLDKHGVIEAQCDADGHPFAKTLGTDGQEILGFTAKDGVTFTIHPIEGVSDFRVSNFFIGSSTVYLLVTGYENARKEEETIEDVNGQETKRAVTRGDLRHYIARYDGDGTYRSALKLDPGFDPMQLAAFDSGSFQIGRAHV